MQAVFRHFVHRSSNCYTSGQKVRNLTSVFDYNRHSVGFVYKSSNVFEIENDHVRATMIGLSFLLFKFSKLRSSHPRELAAHWRPVKNGQEKCVEPSITQPYIA